MTALTTPPPDLRVHDEPVTRPKRLARIAGGLYLLLAVLGGLAQLYVRPRAIVPGDAAAPARQPARRRSDGDLRRGRRRDHEPEHSQPLQQAGCIDRHAGKRKDAGVVVRPKGGAAGHPTGQDDPSRSADVGRIGKRQGVVTVGSSTGVPETSLPRSGHLNDVGPQRPHADTPVPPPPILSARGVVKTYRTGTHEVSALRGIDLDVAAGELVTVMGPSGNGKTTLLNCLSGLDDIDAGTVTVDGADLFAMSDAERTRVFDAPLDEVFQYPNGGD